MASLCAAAIEQSDNTAGNLLLDTIGGPVGLTKFVRSIGDETTRLDRKEPELNSAVPGDERDTTSPAAMSADMQRLVLSNVLSESSRHQLEDWLQHNETGTLMIRASVPKTWIVGDKTGRSGNGATNDVAILQFLRKQRTPLQSLRPEKANNLAARGSPSSGALECRSNFA